jgi:phage shock protein PspC (stress-responsive transcriptional regulator)
METVRRCPYCDEEIRAEAVRCRHCRSRLAVFDPGEWHRDVPDRRVAGVAAAIARAPALPLAAVRFAFLVLTPFHLLGPVAYGALWLLIPFRAGEEPPFARLLGFARRAAAELRDVVVGRQARGSEGPRPPAGDVPAAGRSC